MNHSQESLPSNSHIHDNIIYLQNSSDIIVTILQREFYYIALAATMHLGNLKWVATSVGVATIWGATSRVVNFTSRPCLAKLYFEKIEMSNADWEMKQNSELFTQDINTFFGSNKNKLTGTGLEPATAKFCAYDHHDSPLTCKRRISALAL